MNGRDPWPLCGYGRLGLCCSSCLHGPCRLSPFDETPNQSRCGRDVDQQVALNLHQIASAEALQAIRSLKGIEAFPATGEADSPGRSVEWLRSLFPESAFPHLKGFGIPPESLISFFFEQLEVSGGVEDILTRTLCLSTVPLLSRELTAHRMFLEIGKEVSFLPDLSLPSGDTVPLIILFAEKGSAGEAWGCRRAQEFRDLWGPAAPPLSVSDIRVFPEIGRRIFCERHLPVGLTRTLAVVWASSLSTVLMPLALGFRVVSYPSLPIHGGPGVETYFGGGMSSHFGGQYLPGREGLSLPAVLEELGWSTHPT